MPFSSNWNVDKYKNDYESEDHWRLRREFMLAHKDKFPEPQLVCLTQVFFNMEFLGCRYPEKTMNLVNKLAAEVARDFREGRKGKLKRTFVGAQDAAGAKAKQIRSTATDFNESQSVKHDVATLSLKELKQKKHVYSARKPEILKRKLEPEEGKFDSMHHLHANKMNRYEHDSSYKISSGSLASIDKETSSQTRAGKNLLNNASFTDPSTSSNPHKSVSSFRKVESWFDFPVKIKTDEQQDKTDRMDEFDVIKTKFDFTGPVNCENPHTNLASQQSCPTNESKGVQFQESVKDYFELSSISQLTASKFRKQNPESSSEATFKDQYIAGNVIVEGKDAVVNRATNLPISLSDNATEQLKTEKRIQPKITSAQRRAATKTTVAARDKVWDPLKYKKKQEAHGSEIGSSSDKAGFTDCPRGESLLAAQNQPGTRMSTDLFDLSKVDSVTLAEVKSPTGDNIFLPEESALNPSHRRGLDQPADKLGRLGVKAKRKRRSKLNPEERREACKARLEAKGVKWDPELYGKFSQAHPSGEEAATVGSKRPRESKETPPSAKAEQNRPKRAEGPIEAGSSRTGGSFRTVATRKVAIVPTSFPKLRLSEEQGAEVELLLAARVCGYQPPLEGIFPTFERTYMESGALIVCCANGPSRQWLLDLAPALKLKDGTTLKVGEKNDIFKVTKVMLKIPPRITNMDANTLCKMLDRQNPSLKVRDWKLISYNKDAKSTNLVFAVNNQAVQAIKSASFRAHIALWNATIIEL